MTKKTFNSQLIIGLVVIAVGVLFILDNLDLMYAWDYLRYWPAVFVVVGAVNLLDPRANKFWAGLFVVGGSLLLMDRLDILEFHLRDWWPLILIAIGGTILWGSIRTRGARVAVLDESKGTDEDASIQLTAVMGGVERRNASQDFRGGHITAIMGGCVLDLRGADIRSDEAVLNIFTVWGGIEIRVPESWTIVLKGTPIMGGIEDSTRPPGDGAKKRLIIQGSVIMGGLELKN